MQLGDQHNKKQTNKNKKNNYFLRENLECLGKQLSMAVNIKNAQTKQNQKTQQSETLGHTVYPVYMFKLIPRLPSRADNLWVSTPYHCW